MTTADQTPAGASVPAGPAPDRLRAALSLVRRRTRRMTREWEADRAALITLADAHDQLRTALTELAAEWDARATRYLAWRDHHHDRGDETTARISRVRADMCTRHAERLRALLEDADEAEEDA